MGHYITITETRELKIPVDSDIGPILAELSIVIPDSWARHGEVLAMLKEMAERRAKWGPLVTTVKSEWT